MNPIKTDLNLAIIDVRNPGEYLEGHVQGAVNLPLDQFESGLPELKLDAAQSVIVYCKSGVRSGQALRFLQARKYANAINGISALGVAELTGRPIVTN